MIVDNNVFYDEGVQHKLEAKEKKSAYSLTAAAFVLLL